MEMIASFEISIESRRRHLDANMRLAGFKLIGQGRHRRTYLSPNKKYVLKFPMCSDALAVNRHEQEIWRAYKNTSQDDGTLYAPCRLIKDFVLMMWAVDSSYGCSFGDERAFSKDMLVRLDETDAPSWVFDIDATQAGYLPDGRLVAYDYGYAY